jgi:pyruvate formate lyase activating enzyme
MADLHILQKTSTLHEALWWESEPGNRVHCYLCPRHCHIGHGQSGFCFIRVNQNGKLFNLGYGAPAAIQVDPIEKKPLNHFLPGTSVFSMGTAGCNMGCFFCQNWDISKSHHDQVHSRNVPPEDVPKLALQYGCDSIAFTYNEPTIWGEYVIDICKAAKSYGLKTVMVTNGYITREAFHDIYDHIDAANVDLKAFTENFYGKVTLTHLEPVLKTLAWLKNETSVWFEITNLMIPTLNDDPAETRKLAEWIRASWPRRAAALHGLPSGFQAARQACHSSRHSSSRPRGRSRSRPALRLRRQHFLRRRQHSLSRLQHAASPPFLA